MSYPSAKDALRSQSDALKYAVCYRSVLDVRDALERWCPQKPTTKQKQFLEAEEFEALFGGAAGPGKSSALLMAALQYADSPDYAGLILRRTYADLSLPGAIMDRSHEWLGGTDAHWNGTDKQWVFPSGATVTFGYLDTDRDKYRYQSSEVQYLAFDELTQFPEASYRYLLSRVRRTTESKIPLRVRCASNPGGIGHDWVFARFVDPRTNKGRAFVPALLSDNPYLDSEVYRKALAQLDDTTRKQLEEGVWIRDAQGLVYKFDPQRNVVSTIPTGQNWRYVLGVDFGSSQVDATTAFAVWAFHEDYPIAYLVECEKFAGLIVSTIAEHIRAYMIKYTFDKIVGDQGALGKGYIEEIRKRYAIPMCPAQKQDKLGYRKLMSGELQAGKIQVVEKSASDWIDEASNLIWDEQGIDDMGNYPDHATDAALYGWREARAWLYAEKIPLPKIGTPAYYQRQADAYEAKIRREVVKSHNGGLLEGFV